MPANEHAHLLLPEAQEGDSENERPQAQDAVSQTASEIRAGTAIFEHMNDDVTR